MNYKFIGVFLAAFVVLSFTLGNIQQEKSGKMSEDDRPLIAVSHAQARHNPFKKQEVKREVLLDVPLFNQMDSPRLYNGCEITSLAMVMNYEGISISKNELANEINIVPLRYQNGDYGNPNEGFVGNMQDGPGLGVYHEPIFKLAQKHFNDRAENLTGKQFGELLKKVADGSPVWVITTASLTPAASFKNWDTPDGQVKVSFQMHSVAITGYDENYIFVNDPYGTKNRKVPIDSFISAWELMGSQAVVIN